MISLETKEAEVDPFLVIRTVQSFAVKKVAATSSVSGVIPIQYYVQNGGSVKSRNCCAIASSR